jgi:hypothetical protein
VAITGLGQELTEDMGGACFHTKAAAAIRRGRKLAGAVGAVCEAPWSNGDVQASEAFSRRYAITVNIVNITPFYKNI